MLGESEVSLQTLLLGFCWDMLSQLAVFHDCVFHCCVTSGTIALLILNVDEFKCSPVLTVSDCVCVHGAEEELARPSGR